VLPDQPTPEAQRQDDRGDRVEAKARTKSSRCDSHRCEDHEHRHHPLNEVHGARKPLLSPTQVHRRWLAHGERHYAKSDEEATRQLQSAVPFGCLPDAHTERDYEPKVRNREG